MGENIFDRQMELLKMGVDNPDISDDERKIVAEYLDTMKQLKESARPFIDLNEAAKNDPARFHQELARVYSALVFIQGRTSDDVVRLTETSRNMLISMQKQEELAKKRAEESAVNNETANRHARNAIWISVCSLIVSRVIGIFALMVGIHFGIAAHCDSESSSVAIVTAIKDFQRTMKPEVVNAEVTKPSIIKEADK